MWRLRPSVRLSVCPSVDDLALRNKPFPDVQAFCIRLIYMKFSSKGEFREYLSLIIVSTYFVVELGVIQYTISTLCRLVMTRFLQFCAAKFILYSRV